jgi:diguanylate cyclase (GGDEF)-like protein
MGFDHDITEEAEAKLRVEKALMEAETLRSVTAAVTSTLNQKAVINAILEQAERVISFSSASVQLLSDRELEIVGGIGFPDNFAVEGLKLTITQDTPNMEVIEKKKGLIVNKDLMKKYPAFIDRAKTDIKSWMGVPLLVSGKAIGMIAFDSSREDGFSSAELELAQAFGNQVAVALENARLYEETKKQAITDPLTGSFSRRYLYTSLTKLSSMAFRTETPLTLILFDVDDFKIFNDRYGHQLGDEVLKIVVELTDTVLRKTDILCRYGGEEFVILLPQTGPEEAHAIAERIRNKVESQAVLPGIDRAVTISLGWSLFQSSDFNQIDHFIYRADRALYVAKNKGKNQTAGPSDIPEAD